MYFSNIALAVTVAEGMKAVNLEARRPEGRLVWSFQRWLVMKSRKKRAFGLPQSHNK